jgi:hypothetical protein
MVVANVIIFLLNIAAVIIGYYIVRNKLERILVNKEIIKKVKDEINSIIIQLNESTLNNISLIEEKKKNLDKLVVLADKKKSGLKSKLTEKDELNFDQMLKKEEATYSPEKLIKQKKKAADEVERVKVSRENPKEALSPLDEELKNMPIIDKARYLLDYGFSYQEIQKKIGISSGELELIINIESMKSDYKNPSFSHKKR